MGVEHAKGVPGRVLAVAADLAGRLADALGDPASFRWALGRLGWDVAEPPTEYAQAAAEARQILAAVRSWTGPPSPLEVLSLIDATLSLPTTLRELSAVPPGVDPDAFRDDLAVALPEMLLADALGDLRPGIAELLYATGVLVVTEEPGAGARLPHSRTRLDLGGLRALLSEPAAAVLGSTGWGTASVPAQRTADLLVTVLAGWGLPVATRRLTAAELSEALSTSMDTGGSLTSVLLVDSWTDSGTVVQLAGELVAGGTGADAILELRPRWSAGLAGVLDLGGGWTLEMAAEADPADPPGLRFTPAGTAARPPTGGTGGEVRATLRWRPAVPASLLGDGAVRVELEEVSVTLALTADDPVELRVETDLTGLALVLDPGSADAFLGGIIGDGGRYAVPLSVGYGTSGGLATHAAGRIQQDLPLNLALGPITLERCTLLVGVDDVDPARLAVGRLTVDMAGSVAILSARVEGLGASVGLTAPTGATTLPGLELGPVSPTAIGLSLDAPAVSGGGFIAIDQATGRYAGALGFDALAIGIDALVVVDTRLPGDPDGWALFASLSARFPGIPLGFGFTLTGLGGLLAVNRGLDVDALALGLRTGVIDALLFPDDPVRDSAALIAQIDDYFPILADNVVVGPVIQIGWGTPTIITGELGVVLSLPEGVIAVMGSVAAELPTPEAPLLSLHMDTLGAIDLPAGTFSVVASLYDSTLLETINLDGEMAMYLRATADPYFLLSVGGYHPSFQPPALLPAVFHDLRRMSASIAIAEDIDITLSGYFAVTSNTLQFGGSVRVDARQKVALTTYTASGWFEFDVLLVFSPFAIIADLRAGVSVSAGDRELFGVDLAVHLEGPRPWLASGRAEFEFFGLTVAFAFDIGGQAVGAPPERVDVLEQVVAALESPAAWAADAAGGPVTGVSLLVPDEDGDADVIWVRPDQAVSAMQSVAPLDRDLERVGHLLPLPGQEHLDLNGAGFTDADGVDRTLAWSAREGWFAPAQFETLSSAARLARASYEEMTGGVLLTQDAVGVPEDPETQCTATEDTYEEITWTRPRPVRRRALVDPAVSMRLAAAVSARRTVSARPAGAPRLWVGTGTYTLARTIDGSEATTALRQAGLAQGGVRQGAVVDALRRRVGDDPAEAGRLAVVPAGVVAGIRVA